MKLDHAAELEESGVSLVPFGDNLIYEVKRYDRVDTEGGITRLHQEDFC